MVLPMTNCFREDDPTTDRLLPEKILASEIPGVILWAVEGYKRLKANNGAYTIPQESADATNEWRQSSNSALIFVKENCEECPRVKGAGVRELYRAYRAMCEDSGYRPKNNKNFQEALKEMGIAASKTMGRLAFPLRIRNLDSEERSAITTSQLRQTLALEPHTAPTGTEKPPTRTDLPVMVKEAVNQENTHAEPTQEALPLARPQHADPVLDVVESAGRGQDAQEGAEELAASDPEVVAPATELKTTPVVAGSKTFTRQKARATAGRRPLPFPKSKDNYR